jgi:hypothetical protein
MDAAVTYLCPEEEQGRPGLIGGGFGSVGVRRLGSLSLGLSLVCHLSLAVAAGL